METLEKGSKDNNNINIKFQQREKETKFYFN